MALEISWESTYDDFKAAQNLHRRSSLSFILSYVVVPIACIVLWLLSLVAAVRNQPAVLASLLPWTIGSTVYSVWIWIARSYSFRKAYKNCWPDNARLKVNTLKFTNDGVDVITSEVGSAHFLWNAFSRVREDSKVVMLSISKTRWCAIPKRVMNEQQLAELLGLCATHIRKVD